MFYVECLLIAAAGVSGYFVGWVLTREQGKQNAMRLCALQHRLDLALEKAARRVSLPPAPAALALDATIAYQIAQREAAQRVPAEMVFLSLSTEISQPIFGDFPRLIDDNDVLVIRHDWGKN